MFMENIAENMAVRDQYKNYICELVISIERRI